MIVLDPFDRNFLDLSSEWLRDPEIKAMTLASDFTHEQQEAFFASLPERGDYKIWGVATESGEKIGAAGIKHIVGADGEFWCYIGERTWWGRGIGGRILKLCEEQARRLGIKQLIMIAASDNLRSVKAFEKMGFALDDVDPGEGLVQLRKRVVQ